MNRSRITLAAFTIGTLTACGSGDSTTSPTDTTTMSPEPTATVTASPSPSPSPSPDDDERPSLAELTVSPNGLLPMRIGEAPDEGAAAQMLEFDEEYCAQVAPENPGRWVSTYDRVEGHFGGETEPFTVSVSNDIVTRIDVFGLDLTTEDGVGIGTPLDELRATYPNLASGSSGGDFSSVWWITGEEGFLVFETQADSGGNSGDGQEAVILMRIIERSYDPDFSTTGTDDIAGGCL